MKKKTEKKRFRVWENGFEWGLIADGKIASYSITMHLPMVNDKKKFAKELEKLLNR